MSIDSFELKGELVVTLTPSMTAMCDRANDDLLTSVKACQAFADEDPEGALTSYLSTARIVLERLARDLQLKADEIRDCFAE